MPFLQFDRVSKAFPGVQALEGVSLSVDERSVHALCGENGAGKSTLLKILSGVYQPDSGEIRMAGVPVRFPTPHEALQSGVAVIYQELHLVAEMTVAENILLGHFPNRLGWIDRKRQIELTVDRLREVGIDIDPSAAVGSLPIAQRQMVEIAKALSRNAKVIAFDEPTSSLSAREADKLFTIIEELKARNKAILYVTHRMHEIFRICDAATVLRDGRHVETFDELKSIDAPTLVNRMVGRSIEDIYGYRGRSHGEIVLKVKGVTGPGIAEPVGIEVAKGEIVGIFGLIGAGRTELLKAIYTRSDVKGQVEVERVPVEGSSIRDSIRKGLVLCPEDRKREGIVGTGSVLENINLSARRNFSRGGFWIDDRREYENANRQATSLGVRTPSLNQPVVLLSGGNQQKCILGRWLSESVKVLLLDEPTRGIDVGAKSEIYEIVYHLAEQGVGVVFVSSDLPEVLGVSDRILVMRQGRIVANLSRNEADAETVMKFALPVESVEIGR